MVPGDDRYDLVAYHCRSAHARDLVFGLLLAMVSALALLSVRAASRHVDHALQPAPVCLLRTAC